MRDRTNSTSICNRNDRWSAPSENNRTRMNADSDVYHAQANYGGSICFTLLPCLEQDNLFRQSVSYALTYYGLTWADGTFEVPGPQKRGIPPGRYRVSVALLRVDGQGKQTDRLR